MNIYQYDLLKELLDVCKQISYETDAGEFINLSTKISYIKNLVKEYEKYELRKN